MFYLKIFNIVYVFFVLDVDFIYFKKNLDFVDFFCYYFGIFYFLVLS